MAQERQAKPTGLQRIFEEKYYQLWIQKTVNTIEAHGLEHLIDPSHTPADKKYDKAQQNWLFKVRTSF